MWNWLKKRLKKRSFEGATRRNRFIDWITGSLDSVQENNPGSIKELRNRARDLQRNNEHAHIGVALLTSELISKEGLAPIFKLAAHTKVTDMDIKRMRELPRMPPEVREILARPRNGDQFTPERKFELAIAKFWELFSDNCDFSGKKKYNGLIRVAIGSTVTSGECLIRRIITSDTVVPLQLQLIEADHINDDMDDFIEVFQGIRIDPTTREPIAIKLYKNHPGGLTFKADSSEVSMRDLIHLKEDTRPGQLRGVSWLATVILTLRDLGKAQGFELTRQTVAACFAAFVSGGNAQSIPDYEAGTSTTLASGKIEPGLIHYLKTGESVTMATPPANVGYADFSKINLRRIATGLGLSYSSVSGDFADINFSSGKLGENRTFKLLAPLREDIFADGMATKIAGWFLESLSLIGVPRIPLKIAIPPMTPTSVDSEKEMAVIKERLLLGMTSWQGAVKELGRDPEIVKNEIVEDANFFKEQGIGLSIYGLDSPQNTNPPEEEGPNNDKAGS